MNNKWKQFGKSKKWNKRRAAKRLNILCRLQKKYKFFIITPPHIIRDIKTDFINDMQKTIISELDHELCRRLMNYE